MSKQRRSRSPRARTKALALAVATLALGAATALAAPGDFDTSFDSDGRRTIDLGGSDFAADVLVQPDGKIVLTGTGRASTDILVTRLNPDGSLDTSFDGDGTREYLVGGQDRGSAAALQPDGKIVVVGKGTIDSGGTMAGIAIRLNPDGSDDTTFGDEGLLLLDDGSEAMDVLVQPDGKIVVAGQGGANDIAVTRLNPDGSPDTGFDGDGTIGFDFGGDDYPSGVALQANGRLVVAGHTSVGRNVALVRLDSNGSPDSSFDGDGRKTIDYASERDGASEVLVQPDQKIVVAGSGTLGSDFVVTRLNPDGSPDTGFDGDGTIGVDFGADDFGNAAALQANGKIVVAGDTSGAGEDVAIMRLQPGGSLDTTFSSDGKQTIDFPGDAYGYATALQANGRILVAGEAAGNMLVARLEGDPADSGGGPGGGGPGGGGPGGGPGGGGGFTVPRCAGKRATIVGTSRKDRLRGTRRADVIVALGGNDIIKGGRGNDRICAGTGNDSIAGESGSDRIYGQSGKDKITGGTGNDRIDGGSSSDRIKGQSGKDSLSGGTGNDTIDGGSSKDRINGNSGKDKCNGGSGKDRAKCERKRGI